ncbi:MAG: MFS transporter [Pseudomonadota bacterium]
MRPFTITMLGDVRIIVAAIACIAITGFSIGMSLPLLALVLESRGISTVWIGINVAVGGAGSIAAALLTGPLCRRFSTSLLLILSLVASAVCLFAMYLSPFWLWFPIRFGFVFASTVQFVIAEYWINAAANQDRRGLVLGIYATVLSIGFAGGPVVLSFVGSAGVAPFAIGCFVFIAAIGPIFGAARTAPEAREQPAMSFLSLLWIAPTATLAAFMFGGAEQTGFSFFPVYGLQAGLSETLATLLVSVMVFGNVVFQIPLGLLADRFDRTALLFGISLIGCLGMVLWPAIFATGSPLSLAFLVLFIWGGLTGGFYTVGLAQLGSRFRGSDLASANAMFVLLYSVGSMMATPVAGASMQLFGANGLPLFLAAMFAAYALLALARLIGKRSVPPSA